MTNPTPYCPRTLRMVARQMRGFTATSKILRSPNMAQAYEHAGDWALEQARIIERKAKQ